MKILIADDQVNAGRLLGQLLEWWDYEATVVQDGAAALEVLCGSDPPRLALLDWQMPAVDGIEVCRRLRKEGNRPYTYLVLLTGLGGRDAMLAALDAGADDYLTKPFDEAELKARLAVGRRIVDLQERLHALATQDVLTGLWNRAAILDHLEREQVRGVREGHPVSALLADVDHFKRINDSLGHLAGDEVLRQVARRLREALRPYDGVGRYGGEEFLAVLPGCSAEASIVLAKRLCKRIADGPIEHDGQAIHVTISIGVAAQECTALPNATEMLRLADAGLYRAKEAGRNRVVRA